jgi:hypothetical protein
MTGRTDSRMPENQSQRQQILTVVVENIAHAFPASNNDACVGPLIRRRVVANSGFTSYSLQRRRFKLLQQKTFLLPTLISSIDYRHNDPAGRRQFGT